MVADHPYILAFSLIMLHTDAFNKHNKRKMTKADYMKNTRLPGVPPEVLDVRRMSIFSMYPAYRRMCSVSMTTSSSHHSSLLRTRVMSIAGVA